MSNRSLPNSWRRAILGNHVREAQAGFPSSERNPNGVVQVRLNNVTTAGEFDWSSTLRVPRNQAQVQYLLKPGDVLFCNTNSAEMVGKSAMFREYGEPVVYSNHFTRLRTDADLDPAFLALWLQTQWQAGVFERMCDRWIGQAAVQKDRLLALEVAMPPLPEQHHIVARLNAQMAEVERARAAVRAQIEAAKALPAAYLREVFDGQEAKEWPRMKLQDICAFLPARSIASEGDMTVTAVTTACLTEWGFDPEGVKTAQMAAEDVPVCRVEPGEILIARSNTPDLVGRVSMFEGAPAGAVATDLTIRLSPKGALLAKYLSSYLSSLYLTGYWKEHAGGASGSMKKITRNQLSKELIPVPTEIRTQTRVVEDLQNQLVAARSLQQTMSAKSEVLARLPKELLDRAFLGD